MKNMLKLSKEQYQKIKIFLKSPFILILGCIISICTFIQGIIFLILLEQIFMGIVSLIYPILLIVGILITYFQPEFSEKVNDKGILIIQILLLLNVVILVLFLGYSLAIVLQYIDQLYAIDNSLIAIYIFTFAIIALIFGFVIFYSVINYLMIKKIRFLVKGYDVSIKGISAIFKILSFVVGILILVMTLILIIDKETLNDTIYTYMSEFLSTNNIVKKTLNIANAVKLYLIGYGILTIYIGVLCHLFQKYLFDYNEQDLYANVDNVDTITKDEYQHKLEIRNRLKKYLKIIIPIILAIILIVIMFAFS